ncbi:hypothetical protein KASHIRA_01570 [Serratia phage vB_SmaM-Kashira]|nr:hypothetical protein KASHIRA_01570 [Serratia phage vB_SmaM-Kashira]
MAGPKRDFDKVFEFETAVNPDFLAAVSCYPDVWISYIGTESWDDSIEVIVTSKNEKSVSELAERFGGKNG